MFNSNKKKLKVSELVIEKIHVASQILGCDPDEFANKELLTAAEKILAKTASKEVGQKEVDEIAKKLQGLGYLE